MSEASFPRHDKTARILLVVALVILGLLIVPPLLLLPFVISNPGHGHPPAIIIPYLYVLFGFRYAAPVGAVLALGAGWLAFSRDATPQFPYGSFALAILFGVGSALAWLHGFR